MIKMTMSMNGRPISPNKFAGAFEKAIEERLHEHIRSQLESIRDPSTGERPRLTFQGGQLLVEGSDDVVRQVKERLGVKTT